MWDLDTNIGTVLADTLTKAGWVRTTLDQCSIGDTVLIVDGGCVLSAVLVDPGDMWDLDSVREKGGSFYSIDEDCYRAPDRYRIPATEYASGTKAVIARKILSPDPEPLLGVKVGGGWELNNGNFVEDRNVRVISVWTSSNE